MRALAARLQDALGFLSRLVPPRNATAEGLRNSLPLFAPAGLILGCVFTAGAWLLLTLLVPGPPSFSDISAPALSHSVAVPAFAPASIFVSVLGPLLAAWLWLGLSLWTTRGLHWDGLADLGDACGSNAHGARFWEILRDSRLGALGALCLLLVFSGQWAALCWHVANGHWLVLVLAPAWGRVTVIWLAAAAPAREATSLGGLVCGGLNPALARNHGLAALAVVFVLCLSGLGLWQGLALLAAQYWLTRRLAAVGREQGGISGDFMGAAIVTGELLFLLFTL